MQPVKEDATITRLLAQSTVSDLEAAQEWYTRLFGSGPDANPMPGLLEWHLSETFGLQVYAEPDRAGRSSVVLSETDLDAAAARLAEVGIAHDGVEQVTSSRALQLLDPDGNRVVFTGP